MKKILLTAGFISLFANSNLSAQEVNPSRINVLMYGGLGYGKVINSSEPGYDLKTSTAELLLNYRFSKSAGIAGGIGFSELSGNGFNSRGNFYHERSALKIPVVLTLNFDTGHRSQFFAQLGPYAQTTLQDRQSYLSFSENDVYKGWNFGAQIGVGITYDVFDHMSFGLQLLAQSDFNNLNSATYSNSQKVKNLASMGLLVNYDL